MKDLKPTQHVAYSEEKDPLDERFETNTECSLFRGKRSS